MFSRFVAVASIVALLCGCVNNRGGVTDALLDKTLYTAETKAERLLRYYEIQTLLVRYAALFGGTSSERNAIAAANVVATGRLNEVFVCLHYGAVHAAVAQINKVDPINGRIRNTGYCSFFDTRMLSYENALASLMRQAVGFDQEVSQLKAMIEGLSVADVWTIATDLLTLAKRIARDVRVIDAFKADARELQFLIHHRIAGPDEVTSDRKIGGIYPESAKPEVVENKLAGYESRKRPEVLVWHFQEVSAFMRDSCIALNDDAEMRDFKNTRCSNGIPFLEDIDGSRAMDTVTATAKGDPLVVQAGAE